MFLQMFFYGNLLYGNGFGAVCAIVSDVEHITITYPKTLVFDNKNVMNGYFRMFWDGL
jgi:hypothetical protein